MRNKKHISAFTLIEVLIALIIIAISLTAIFKAINSNVRDSSRVEMKMAAEWVALNEMSRMQLGLDALPQAGDNTQGQANIMNTDFTWTVTVPPNATPYYERISVDVFNDSRQLVHLDGFVRL